jgi:hypothetical protein
MSRNSFVFLSFVFLVAGCSGGSSGGGDPVPALPTPLAERFAIDGIVDFTPFTPSSEVINIRSAFGTGAIVGTTTLKWVVTNDDRNLYIALEWDDATQNSFDPAGPPIDFDGLYIQFDVNGNNLLEANEGSYRLVMSDYGSLHADLHADATEENDSVSDGLGKMTYSVGTQKYQAELLIPLVDDVNGEDGLLSATTKYNINIYEHMEIFLAMPSGNIGALNDVPGVSIGTDTSAWPALPYIDAAQHDQPDLPTNLTGLIVFVSDRDTATGELYTFDPATGIVNRVTNSIGVAIDNPSLSHDRTKISFTGAANILDFTTYEIYSVDVDGNNLVKLTNNIILDGHPAWSPDDSEIAYASFRDPGKASIVRMTAAGAEILDLTLPADDDNDPDYLPDGRIVFKTDRFSTKPEFRMAVMNVDGSGVVQLTNVSGVSDHDPIANNSVTLFERFTKNTDYTTDPEALYAPWDIVEANIDGSGERTLVGDAWINWLPVFDPSNQYIVHLKTVGYTDTRLINKNGRDLGRLIPDYTRIRYIDWK